MTHEFKRGVALTAVQESARAFVFAAAIQYQRMVKQALNLGKSPPPSVAPAGPYKDTGTLGRSFQIGGEGAVLDQSKAVGSNPQVKVGTAIVYAPRLEFGFLGTDSKGRSVKQKPRPFMRNTLANGRSVIIRVAKKKAAQAFEQAARRSK